MGGRSATHTCTQLACPTPPSDRETSPRKDTPPGGWDGTTQRQTRRCAARGRPPRTGLAADSHARVQQHYKQLNPDRRVKRQTKTVKRQTASTSRLRSEVVVKSPAALHRRPRCISHVYMRVKHMLVRTTPDYLWLPSPLRAPASALRLRCGRAASR